MSVKLDNNPPLLPFGQPFCEEVNGFTGPTGAPPVQSQLTQAAYAFLNGLYTRPNYHDMIMTFPGTISTAGASSLRYPCPPDVQVKPLSVAMATLNTPATGSDATISIWRGALAPGPGTPGIPGGKLFDITFFAGSNDGIVFTTYDEQNFTVPGVELFIIINTVGSGVAGANLRVIVRG